MGHSFGKQGLFVRKRIKVLAQPTATWSRATGSQIGFAVVGQARRRWA